METKELLAKTYECETLEDLLTLINGNNLVGEEGSRWNHNTTEHYIEVSQVIGNDIIKVRTEVREKAESLYDGTFKAFDYVEGWSRDYVPVFAEWIGSTYRDHKDMVKLPCKIRDNIYFIDDKCDCYRTKISFEPKRPDEIVRSGKDWEKNRNYYDRKKNMKIKIDKWKKTDRTSESGRCIQPINKVLEIFKKNHPYTHKWFLEYIKENPGVSFYTNAIDIPFVVTHPELELLGKMVINGNKGLLCINRLIRICCTKSEQEAFNRNFKPGKNAAEIFTVPMDAVKILWRKDIGVWDDIRKMINLRGCTIDDLVICDERNLRSDQYKRIDEILRAKHEDKPVFTFTGLLRYLQKIDVNEAIGIDEGLDLIRDTIALFNSAQMVPNFDTDSLKRTHDVTMRNARIIRNEVVAKKIETACTNKYEFSLGKYFVRQIKSYDDLIDEGTQQSNCLRYVYANQIADGKCLIYVMRKIDEPDKSLISIELDPTGQFVRQQLAAYNARIQNDSQLKFLEKWNEYRAEINSKEDKVAKIG